MTQIRSFFYIFPTSQNQLQTTRNNSIFNLIWIFFTIDLFTTTFHYPYFISTWIDNRSCKHNSRIARDREPAMRTRKDPDRTHTTDHSRFRGISHSRRISRRHSHSSMTHMVRSRTRICSRIRMCSRIWDYSEVVECRRFCSEIRAFDKIWLHRSYNGNWKLELDIQTVELACTWSTDIFETRWWKEV